MNERRFQRPRAARIPLDLPVTGSTTAMFLESRIMNLSQGGLFLRAEVAPPLGTEVELRFHLPNDGTPIRAIGTIVWIRTAKETISLGGPNHPPGIGIAFKEISRADLERISVEALKIT